MVSVNRPSIGFVRPSDGASTSGQPPSAPAVIHSSASPPVSARHPLMLSSSCCSSSASPPVSLDSASPPSAWRRQPRSAALGLCPASSHAAAPRPLRPLSGTLLPRHGLRPLSGTPLPRHGDTVRTVLTLCPARCCRDMVFALFLARCCRDMVDISFLGPPRPPGSAFTSSSPSEQNRRLRPSQQPPARRNHRRLQRVRPRLPCARHLKGCVPQTGPPSRVHDFTRVSRIPHKIKNINNHSMKQINKYAPVALRDFKGCVRLMPVTEKSRIQRSTSAHRSQTYLALTINNRTNLSPLGIPVRGLER